MQVCDAYYAHGGFGIYTDFSTQQENLRHLVLCLV